MTVDHCAMCVGSVMCGARCGGDRSPEPVYQRQLGCSELSTLCTARTLGLPAGLEMRGQVVGEADEAVGAHGRATVPLIQAETSLRLVDAVELDGDCACRLRRRGG